MVSWGLILFQKRYGYYVLQSPHCSSLDLCKVINTLVAWYLRAMYSFSPFDFCFKWVFNSSLQFDLSLWLTRTVMFSLSSKWFLSLDMKISLDFYSLIPNIVALTSSLFLYIYSLSILTFSYRVKKDYLRLADKKREDTLQTLLFIILWSLSLVIVSTARLDASYNFNKEVFWLHLNNFRKVSCCLCFKIWYFLFTAN